MTSIATSGRNVLAELDKRVPTSFYWSLTLLATLGGFLFGYDTANIGSALPFVPYDLSGFALGYLVAGACRHGLEAHPVGRAGDGHGVAPAIAHRAAQAVREVDPLPGQHRARPARPVARPVPGRGDDDFRLSQPGQEAGRPRGLFPAIHIEIIDNWRSFNVMKLIAGRWRSSSLLAKVLRMPADR
jgi:hypothetical protein